VTAYRDIKKIGVGGNAEVHECERDGDKARFAKKRLLDTADDETKDRFLREVRLLAKLDHPNIVSVVTTRFDKEPLWFVMPLYEASLDDQFPGIAGDMPRIKKIFGSILDAVEYAHAEGVIHRDLKPANVLMNSDDDVVVSDFGLGRFIDSESTRLTQSGNWLGTPLYMAPEQSRGTKVADARSDVFSLGRILYELVTGSLTTAVQDTSSLDPGIALIIERCTKTNPAARFPAVTDLKTAWRTAVGLEEAGSDSERLSALSAKLASDLVPTTTVVKEVFDILSRHADDMDLLHNTVMALQPAAALKFVESEPKRARVVLRRFTDHIEAQSWPFSYTDKIGDVCARLFNHITDAVIRADLLHCLIELGVGHNRFYVTALAQKLLNQARTPAENIALAERIHGASPRNKDWLLENLPMSRRDRMLERALGGAQGNER
jgi:eukaryotic-like serine/threonine-protein kinase